MTPEQRCSGKAIYANNVDTVGRLAVVAVLRCTVPTRDHLAIMKQLEEVGRIRWMRRVDRILKPDLGAWIDRNIAGSYRTVVWAKGRTFLVKWVARFTWPEFWEFANVKLRDNAHIYASKLHHLGLCSAKRGMKRRAHK